MSAAAVTALRRRRLIRRFREAGAIDREHAVSLEILGKRRTWVFDQMVRAGVFIPTQEGHYFLDEAAAAEFRHRYRVRALVVTAICLLLWLILWVAGMFRK